MVYDSTVKKMVLFGGARAAPRSTIPGTTILPTEAGPGHSHRRVAACARRPRLVYDSAKRQLVLYGGSDGVATYYNDLWTLRR